MLKLLAPVNNIRFDIEDALEKQTYTVLDLPFNGMDKSASAVCELFVNSTCNRNNLCPFRHVKGDKSVVCKHWLRGLCKKGDECEFLHEYDMSKMPECYFYSRYSQCGNKECEFLHVDRESKIKDCPWYDRGFCRHGPNCKNRHQKKVICQNYLFGFCNDGPNCKFKHPKFELPISDSNLIQKKQIFVCDYCGEKGHKVTSCFKLNPEHRIQYQMKKEASFMHDMNTSYGSNEMTFTSDQNSFRRGDDDSFSFKPNQIPTEDQINTSRSSDNGGTQMDLNKENGSSQNSNTSFNSSQQFAPFNQHQQSQGQHHTNNNSFNNIINNSGQQMMRPPYHHNNHHQSHYHQNQPHFHHNNQHNFNERFHQPIALADVTCFKCGEKGHYANRCNKSVYSFLRGGGSVNDQDQNK